MLWGIHAKRAFEAIGKSQKLAKRLEALSQQPIRADRIAQIHETWRAARRAAYESDQHQPGSGFLWAWTIASLTRDSRKRVRPNGTAGQRLTDQELADVLIENGGNWGRGLVGPGDLDLTKQAAKAKYAAPTIKKRGI